MKQLWFPRIAWVLFDILRSGCAGVRGVDLLRLEFSGASLSGSFGQKAAAPPWKDQLHWACEI